MADPEATTRVLTAEEALACEVVALAGQLKAALDQLGEARGEVAALAAKLAAWEKQTQQRVNLQTRTAVLSQRYGLPGLFKYETDKDGVVRLTDQTPPAPKPPAPPSKGKNGAPAPASSAREDLLAAVAAAREGAPSSQGIPPPPAPAP